MEADPDLCASIDLPKRSVGIYSLGKSSKWSYQAGLVRFGDNCDFEKGFLVSDGSKGENSVPVSGFLFFSGAPRGKPIKSCVLF